MLAGNSIPSPLKSPSMLACEHRPSLRRVHYYNHLMISLSLENESDYHPASLHLFAAPPIKVIMATDHLFLVVTDALLNGCSEIAAMRHGAGCLRLGRQIQGPAVLLSRRVQPLLSSSKSTFRLHCTSLQSERSSATGTNAVDHGALGGRFSFGRKLLPGSRRNLLSSMCTVPVMSRVTHTKARYVPRQRSALRAHSTSRSGNPSAIDAPKKPGRIES